MNSEQLDHLVRFLVHAAGPLLRAKLSTATKAEKDELRALIADTSSPHRESKLQRVERVEKEQREAKWARDKAEAERVGKLRERAESELQAEEAQQRAVKVAERVHAMESESEVEDVE